MKRLVFYDTFSNFVCIDYDIKCLAEQENTVQLAGNVKSAILIERDTGKYYMKKIGMNSFPLRA